MAQLVHFAVVAQLVHFAVVAQLVHAGVEQLVHCAHALAVQVVLAAVVLVGHGAVAAVTPATVNERAATTTSIEITAFFIQFLLFSLDVVPSCPLVFFLSYKYILYKILELNKKYVRLAGILRDKYRAKSILLRLLGA